MDAQLIYPAPLFVRNTFIDCMEARPPSLEEFLQERLVKSCPTSGVSDVERPQQGHSQQMLQSALCLTRQSGTAAVGEGDNSSECSTTDTAAGIGGPVRQPPGDVRVLDLQSALYRAPAAASVAAPAAAPAPASGALPAAVVVGPSAGTASPAGSAPEASAAGLAHEQREVPAGEMPSAGSAAHFAGRCKPCAFVNSKGCSIGKECQFCHICEPGEKKRRQKEKRAFFSTMRRLQKTAGENLGWR